MNIIAIICILVRLALSFPKKGHGNFFYRQESLYSRKEPVKAEYNMQQHGIANIKTTITGDAGSGKAKCRTTAL